MSFGWKLLLPVSLANLVVTASGDHLSAAEARMSVPFFVFFACAVLAVVGAVVLILAREPIHSALALVLVMVSLAVLYLLLGARFIAAVQIIVYAGAIMVLFVFVIMLLNAGVEERTDYSKIAKFAGVPLASSCCSISPTGSFTPDRRSGRQWRRSAVRRFRPRALSAQLFQQYLFPFEATSILILVAILGALVLARKDE